MPNILINCHDQGGKPYAGSRDNTQAVGTACVAPNRYYSTQIITLTSAFKKYHKFYILLFIGSILHEKSINMALMQQYCIVSSW